MKKYKIFVSGVQKELKEERRAIKDFISNDVLFRDNFDVFLFEDFPAKGKPSENAYRDEVRKCDIYIGILGKKYGNVGKNKLSSTEAEFREAQKKQKAIFVYIKGGNGNKDQSREEGIRKLIAEIKDPKKGYSYRRFQNVSDLKTLVYESLISFLREKGIVGRGDFDQRVCEGARFTDIDEANVKWFLQVARERRNFPLNPEASAKNLLAHLNLLCDGNLTNAAVLLFGKNPHKFFLQAEVKCIQFPSTEVEKPFTSYHIHNGNLFEQVDKSLAFVLDAIRLPVVQQEHTAQVKRQYELPVFAIQEAIVNAVIHRDYNTTSGVQVMVFLDRVEVWNSGALPEHLKLSDLKKPHASYPNNPLLAGTFYLADYIQKAGSGTLEMLRQCRAQGLPEPEFISIRNMEFRTILHRDVFTDGFLLRSGLNERQIKAIKFIKERGEISRKEYVALVEISPRMAHLDLTDLVKKKLLVSMGKGRAVKYTLHK